MKNLVDVLDLSVEEIDGLIATAEDIFANPEKYAESMKHKILATLFFEPSTRTRLSFETAMLSLGGSVVGFSDAQTSSSVKGESLADTIKVVSGYTDIIAMRHPKEGAPYIACEKSLVPIINAGDGGHSHPTQTLADLLTIKRELGRFSGLTVGFCGDLKYGRTVHSLVGAMARYENVRFVFISPKELAVPDFVKETSLKNVPYKESETLETEISDLDILYMTRVQQERFDDKEKYERLKDVYVLTEEKMALAKKDMIVMHPLPRVNEISEKIDSDPRAAYFRQTVNGKLMRMALILKLISEKDGPDSPRYKGEKTVAEKCGNVHCITTSEKTAEQSAYVSSDGKTRCAWCDAEI